MTPVLLNCTKCHSPLPSEIYNREGFTKCAHCQLPAHVDAFPSLLKQEEGSQSSEAIHFEGEAACFYHPAKKAVVPCSSCGRFLCSLCDIEIGGNHTCPQCLESGKEKQRVPTLESKRVLYDDIAVSLAIIPMLFFWATIFTAPATIFVAIKYWKKPTSILPRRKFRYIVAIFIASLQITGWMIFFIYLGTR